MLRGHSGRCSQEGRSFRGGVRTAYGISSTCELLPVGAITPPLAFNVKEGIRSLRILTSEPRAEGSCLNCRAISEGRRA